MITLLSTLNHLSNYSPDWFLTGFFVSATIVVSLGVALFRSERKFLKQLTFKNEDSQEKLETLNQELQNKSDELTRTSLQLMALENMVEKFLKNASSLKELNDIKANIGVFEKEFVHKKQSVESSEIFLSNTNAEFFEELQDMYPKLSKQDLKLLALLKVNLTNKEISKIFNVTEGAVFQSKRRLKKKLGLRPEEKLRKFISHFDKQVRLVL